MWNRVDRFVWTCLTRGEHQPILIKHSLFHSLILSLLGANVKFDNNLSPDNYTPAQIDSILYLKIEITCQLCNVNIECITGHCVPWMGAQNEQQKHQQQQPNRFIKRKKKKMISIITMRERERVSKTQSEPGESEPYNIRTTTLKWWKAKQKQKKNANNNHMNYRNNENREKMLMARLWD